MRTQSQAEQSASWGGGQGETMTQGFGSPAVKEVGDQQLEYLDLITSQSLDHPPTLLSLIRVSLLSSVEYFRDTKASMCFLLLVY